MKIHLSKNDVQRMANDQQLLANLINPLIGCANETVTPEEVSSLLLNGIKSKALTVRPTFMGGIVIEFSEEYMDDFSSLFLRGAASIAPHIFGLINAMLGQQDNVKKFYEKWLS